MPRMGRFTGAVLGVSALLVSLAACAEGSDSGDDSSGGGAGGFPNDTVTLVVGSGPGSGFDFLARGLSPRLQELWGVSVVVENAPGANQTIAYQQVADADPDGHTLLLGVLNTFAIADQQGTLETGWEEMEWFATLSAEPWTFFANANGDIQTFDDLLNEQPIRFGDGGFESPVTPVALSLFEALDEGFLYTPGYDPGETPDAVLGGEQNFVGREAGQFQRYGQEEEFRGIFVASHRAHPLEPDAATLADIEQQYDVEIPDRPLFSLDLGIAATPGTPTEDVDLLADSIATLVEEDEEFQQWIEDNLLEQAMLVDNIGREPTRERVEAFTEDVTDFGVGDLEERLT